MGTTPNLLNEENIQEVIAGIVGFVLLAILREFRRRSGKESVDDDIKELRRQLTTVNESYKDLYKDIITAAEQRELEAAAIALAKTRKVRALESELEKTQERARTLEARNAELILKALEMENNGNQ